MTLGNHEFDGGEAPLVDFIKELNFPMICANVKTTNQDLANVLMPYKVFEKHGLAIVAVTTDDIPGLSWPGPGTITTSIQPAFMLTRYLKVLNSLTLSLLCRTRSTTSSRTRK